MKKPAIPFPNRRHSLLLLLAVCLSFCGCKKYSPYTYKVIALHLYNVDNSGSSPVEDSTGPIAAKAYAMLLQYTAQLYGPNKNGDPDGGTYSLASPVTAFNVYSNTDFDSTHPAGTSLNDYFLYTSEYSPISSRATIANAVANGMIANTAQSNDSAADSLPWQSVDMLVLMQPPAIPGYRNFRINILFADNTQLTDSIFVTLR